MPDKYVIKLVVKS